MLCPAAIRKDLVLDAALEKVVGRLQHMQRRDTPEGLHLRDREIAHPDGADLSLLIERSHRRSGFLHRHQRVRPVHLVDIDVIGAQTPQRVFDLARDALAARVAEHASVAPLQADFGGDDRARAQSGRRQRLADDFLGAAESVDRRGVDDGDALIQRGADRLDRFLLVAAAPHPAAYGPGADGDARDFDRGAGDPGEWHVGVERFRIAAHDLLLS